MGTTVSSAATFMAGGPDIVFPSGIDGTWQTVVDDGSNAAVAAGVLLNPRSYTSDSKAASYTPIILGAIGTKIRLAYQYGSSVTWIALNNDATVRVFGADKVPDSTGAFPSGTIFWRLDAITFNSAGTTMTSPDTNDQTINGANAKLSTTTSNDGYLLRGAKSVLVIVEVNLSFDGVTPLGSKFPIVAQVF